MSIYIGAHLYTYIALTFEGEKSMEKNWWKSAVGYQIYPRSFYDSNNDGVGDLPGIIEKLDYIEKLGINLIWIGPFYKSPMDDNGYDVSDFYDVDPLFGSLEDAKKLVTEAHKRGIKIILDLVLNHSSDEHPWFMESKSSLDNPKRDYYIWKEGKKDENGLLIPPTNWGSFFEGSAWNFDPITQQYYMKIFSNKMPDFNWSSPTLREELFRVARWWLDVGIDGFRVDAIAHLARDLSFADSTLPLNDHGVAPDWSKFSNREELFGYIHEFSEKVLSQYDCMTVGEVGGGADVKAGLRYAGYNAKAFNMVFNFDTVWQSNVHDAKYLEDDQIVTNVLGMKKTFNYWINGMKDKGWLPQYWMNHDHPRVMSQYGEPLHHHQTSGSMLGAVLLTLPGTPFIYNGEEIGMTNVDYTDINDFKDVWVKNQYTQAIKKDNPEIVIRDIRRKSRDNARTPMQWSDAPFAGFSTVEPIQKVVQNYTKINVAAQEKDPHSILSSYRTLIDLRRHSNLSDLLVYGDFELIQKNHPDVFAYVRSYKGKQIVIVANFRKTEITFNLRKKVSKIRFSNVQRTQKSVTKLFPFEVLIAELSNVA